MNMIKPNLIFNYWRADEVAECMEGVSDTDLYATLWRDIVPLQSDEFHETPEVGREALAKYWHLLSETDQALLNELDDYWHLHASGQAVCLL
jgi:hypothetical protein